MAFLFGSRGRQKQPAEIARSLKDLLGKLGETGKNGGGGIGKVRLTSLHFLDTVVSTTTHIHACRRGGTRGQNLEKRQAGEIRKD
jgi:hypothetical protein